MSNQTAQSVTDFIKEKFTDDKTSLLIDFYGGEPLLSTGLIKSISRDLKSFTESRGASYSFSLVTNGSLFKRRVVEDLVSYGLKTVKITLDGPKEIHNKYRPFKSGAGSFDTIIRNIKETWDLVQISIGGNFERTNYEKFPLLLDYLLNEGITPDKIAMIKFDPVTKNPEGDFALSRFKGGCTSIHEPWLLTAHLQLREEILKRGYNTIKPQPMTCMIEIQDTYVVNFDGVIYKCPAFIGHNDYAVGDLETGLINYSSSYRLGLWKNEECAQCEYLPMCFGGCRYMTFVRDGNINQLDCRKAFFDASLETLIKQDLKYRQR